MIQILITALDGVIDFSLHNTEAEALAELTSKVIATEYALAGGIWTDEAFVTIDEARDFIEESNLSIDFSIEPVFSADELFRLTDVDIWAANLVLDA
jgi:hypothetical protein